MIVVIGQNSTWQKTYFFDTLDVGAVNRVGELYESPAGKGSNVSRVLALYGIEHKLLAYVGGGTGARFADGCRADGVDADFVEIAGESRMAVTLIESSGRMTELVEPAPPITEAERAEYHRRFHRHIASASFLSVSGTAMVGEDPDCYLEFTRSAREREVIVIVDSYRDHGRRALKAQPEILKINEHELGELSGCAVGTPAERRRACDGLSERFGIRWSVITRGSEPTEATNGRISLVVRPPAVKAVNPIGSGDSVTSGILSVLASADHTDGPGGDRRKLLDDDDLFARAVVEGVAAGTANCLDWKPGRIERAALDRIRGETTAEIV